MGKECVQAKTIGHLEGTMIRMVDWQKTQNGYLDQMNKRLWWILVTMLGVFITISVNGLFLVLRFLGSP